MDEITEGVSIDCDVYLWKVASSGRGVKKRVEAGWSGRRRVWGDVCDRVSPAIFYELETVVLTKRHEAKLEVAELMMQIFPFWPYQHAHRLSAACCSSLLFCSLCTFHSHQPVEAEDYTHTEPGSAENRFFSPLSPSVCSRGICWVFPYDVNCLEIHLL